MTQDWLFDFGNTRLKCAPLGADGAPGAVRAFAPSEFEALPSGDVAFVASVAAEDARVQLLDALSRRFRRISIARTTPRLDRLRIAYPNPAKLGVDRYLAMAGARDAWPALVVGVGTGLTIDLVDGEGHHQGGRIAPSPTLMREMLHVRATQLPPIGGTYAEFASDTEDALVSGCEGAALALIERSLAEAARQLGATPRLLLHGGGAEPLCAHLPSAQSRPSLVLEGLAHWARLERDA
jgi:type III pantothenate kinase